MAKKKATKKTVVKKDVTKKAVAPVDKPELVAKVTESAKPVPTAHAKPTLVPSHKPVSKVQVRDYCHMQAIALAFASDIGAKTISRDSAADLKLCEDANDGAHVQDSELLASVGVIVSTRVIDPAELSDAGYTVFQNGPDGKFVGLKKL